MKVSNIRPTQNGSARAVRDDPPETTGHGTTIVIHVRTRKRVSAPRVAAHLPFASCEAHHAARLSVVDGDRPGVPRFHERGSRGAGHCRPTRRPAKSESRSAAVSPPRHALRGKGVSVSNGIDEFTLPTSGAGVGRESERERRGAWWAWVARCLTANPHRDHRHAASPREPQRGASHEAHVAEARVRL